MLIKLLYGAIFGTIGQILTFLQLQGNVKYGWYDKYPMIMLGMSIPIAWIYIKSVEYFVSAFNGQLWPSRLIGFGIGIVIFTTMSMILFKESITMKTVVSLILAFSIVGIQLFWK